MNAIRMAMAQMLVEPGRAEANLARAAANIAQAGAAGAEIVVLPECLDLGWTHPSARTQAQAIPGPACDCLCQAARQAKLYVVAGLVERAGPRIYNAAVLIDRQGRVLAKHRKINELDIARDLYSLGDRLGVTETELGTLGITICADNFPESLALGESLARMGAEALLSPCAWAVPADHDNRQEPYGDLWRNAYGELARRCGLPTVGVSNVGPLTAGPWAGRKCIGCSLAMSRDGQVLAEGPYGETAEALLLVELSKRERLSQL